MSQLVYPSLPGAMFPSRTVMAPPVSIKTTPSQREFRARDSAIPRYRYSVAYEFLRVAPALAEYQALLGFFNRVGGTFDDWLFADPDDNTVTNTLFGQGDGVSQVFQLGRMFGGFFEPVFGPGAGVTIKVDGVVEAGAVVDNFGQVTLPVPPDVGAVLQWSGPFYWRCRFASETLEFLRSYQTFLEAKRVEFITVKPL
jgi:hypothetical protein